MNSANKNIFMSLLLQVAFIPLCMAADFSETPRIDYVVPLSNQPQEFDETTIWYDDFNGTPKEYADSNPRLDAKESFGGKGKSMLCLYKKGQHGTGGCKVFFGDSPTYVNKAVRRKEKFDEIYWRIYVKHQYGWRGAPAKMSRATSLTSPNWAQAMIAHVWSSSNNSLTLDPVSCVQGNKVMTTKYNDWKGLKWLGNKPVSKFPIHATEESGYWVLVECRVKLNTPGKSDGINQLWIDGRLECERRNLNFRGNYTKHGINAVFLEAYWNAGAPVTESRWYDNFIISTKKIGPAVCGRNPTIVKTPYHGKNGLKWWEFEVSEDFNGKNIVFRSKRLKTENPAVVDIKYGRFVGKLTGDKSLKLGGIYYIRVRQNNKSGGLSGWSRWHQGFKVK